jgi:3-hydroxybutyryl-CoA dehydratase
MTWKFRLPIYIGDTIHAQVTVIELKAMPRVKSGAATLEVQVINQENKVVQSGKWLLLVASRPEGE